MKKVLLICLTVILTLGCLTAIAFAADTANTAGTYMASIPDYIEPQSANENVDNSAYTVTASDINIAEGKTLKAQVLYENTLTEENGITITYKLVGTNGEDITNNTTIFSQDGNGEVIDSATCTFGAIMTEKAKYAGVYSGTATFSFTVTDKTYTLEEIEADPYMYAIGRTKPEYVVARFNEDFSEVTIFKNGEDSDGDMRSFSYEGQHNNNNIVSPMIEHANTLTSAIVEEGVTTIGGFAFYQCSNLQNVISPSTLIEIGKGDTSKENDASDGHVFYGCSKLQMPNFQNGLQKIRERSFYKTTALTGELIMPDSVSDVDDSAFAYSGITAAYISKGMKTISDSTFWHCDDLKIVDIPNTIVTIEDGAFFDTGLESVFIPDSVTHIGTSNTVPSSVFGTTWGTGAFSACDSLTTVTGMKNVILIGAECFKSDPIQNIEIPERLETIGDAAFQYSYALSPIESFCIPATVTSIGESAIVNLRNVTIDPNNTTFVEQDGCIYSQDMSRVLWSSLNENLTSVTLPQTVAKIDMGVFLQHTNLLSVDLSKTMISEISEYTFSGCHNLSELSLPSTLQIIEGSALQGTAIYTLHIPASVNQFSASVFEGNLNEQTLISHITVDENNQTYKDIDGVVFTKDGSTLVYYPRGYGLTEYSVPEGTTTISRNAFSHGRSALLLTDIIIPDSVINIDNNAFMTTDKNLITIHGSSGSYAETWATTNGYTFVAQ